MNNIFIISARRSGTHLLTDTIINNFNIERIDGSIDYDFLTDDNVDEFIEVMNTDNKLAWSHSHNFDNFFDKNINHDKISELRKLFRNSKIIYIYRDIRDVITSHYYRPYNQKRYNSFIEYYNTHDMRDFVGLTNYDETYDDIVTTLINQHKNWFSVYFAKEILGLDMLLISYEEIIENYNESLNKLSKFIGDAVVPEVKDVRLTPETEMKNDIIYTSHHFRQGSIGDWKNVICEQWGLAIDERYRKQVRNHVNAYLSNPEVDKYQINSNDWEMLDELATLELEKHDNKFGNDYGKVFIDNRYLICDRKLDDVRYSHKIFFYDDIVLKYIIPCKADLDKKTFNHVVPVASKLSLLNIIETYDALYDLDLIPKIHYANIHDGLLVIIQDKIEPNNFVYRKFVTKPNWDWMVNNNIFPMVLYSIKQAIKHNILLSDYVSPYNLAIVNGKLKCVDLDGIHQFESYEELISSDEYGNLLSILNEIDEHWIRKNGNSELKKYFSN